jgi:outer membrane immunogenic protein
LQIGYDWQNGPAVVGVVGDWNWAGASAFLRDDPSDVGDNNFISSQMDWFATLRGRAGLGVGNTLFYVTGGVVWADIDTTITDAPVSFFADHSRVGLVGGAGTEFMIGGNWSVGAEVLYMQFAEQSETFDNGNGTLFLFDLNDSALVARLALNYRMGGGSADAYSAAGYEAGPARFSGFFAGLNAGGVAYSATRNDNDGFLIDNSGWTVSDIHGTVGGEIGYDWQNGNRVLGLAADWNWVGVSVDTPNNPNGGSIGGIVSQMDWFATFRGRAGLAIDKTLVYVTGGAALGSFDTTITDLSGGAVSVFVNDDTRWGLVGGVGADHSFGNNWSLGVEVLYMQFAEESAAFLNNNGTPFQFDYNDSAVVGKAKLSYRFGG